MPAKRGGRTVSAAAEQTPTTPATPSPAKSATTPSPARRQSSTPEKQRGPSSAAAAAAAASPPPLPPAPANSPVPATTTATPRRSSSEAVSRGRSGGAVTTAATPVAATRPPPRADTPASPARPPPPPPSPAPQERPAVQRPPPSPAKAPAAVAASTTTPTTSQSKRGRSARRRGGAVAAAAPAASPDAHFVEHLLLESNVIAPDVSGVRCLAVHPSEHELVVARENGSLVRYAVSFFQGVSQFVQRRHTGGQTHRTVSGLAYVALPTSASGASRRHVLLAAMLSGQVVVYDAELLVPLALHQRSGGAIWALHAVSAACVYAAMADGSWQQLSLTCKRDGSAPQLVLVRVVPGISGADRALSVTASLTLRMAVGSDDAGNVNAWRLPAGVSAGSSGSAAGAGGGVGAAGEDAEEVAAAASGRARGLAEHETLWTTKLAKGIALSCAVVGGTARPCVVLGTSMGDVVLLDAAHGHVFQTFSQHKGPVTALAVQGDAVVYASGWHESLRSYRCSEQGDWYPAEVKRRTHYHEASQLALLPHRQLLLSASRDGTVMYAPMAKLFTSPAMYVSATTQQFAYAAGRAVLLQSRFDTIEAFCMDSAARHWVPLFGHRLDGRFHLSRLWCDPQLHYIVFSTEERVGLLKVVWRAQGAMAVTRLEQVLELPARSGVVDVCWATAAAPTVSQRLYLLFDNSVACVTLADGYPVVHTPVLVPGKLLPDDSVRPYCVLCRPLHAAGTAPQAGDAAAAAMVSEELIIFGYRGSCRMRVMADGTPDVDSLVADLDDVYESVHVVPELRTPTGTGTTDATEHAPKRLKTEAPAPSTPARAAVLVGLSVKQQRYVVGSTLDSSAAAAAAAVPMAATLPHDVRWIARLPPAVNSSSGAACRYLGYFSRGLLVAAGDSWHMVRRMKVEAAFLVRGDAEVLVLDRNLEKTLEALPLAWKVRRFGN